MAYDSGYPTKPIGGGNPYYCCAHCKISDPQINGELTNHAEWCQYRMLKEARMGIEELSKINLARDRANPKS